MNISMSTLSATPDMIRILQWQRIEDLGLVQLELWSAWVLNLVFDIENYR
ncbi:MAG: hypothetical protein ACI30H_02845 [Paludibacteraceae bacterium]